ncbi:winged helix-turn-helix domain-containing protein [bacterium]|nr:winged helix-turn-helix domain-containing protein [bacterium]
MENLTYEVGTVAGDIWTYLKENGEVTVPQLKKALVGSKPSQRNEMKFSMGLGWLLRENNLKLDESGLGRSRRVKVTLSEDI